jgi:hypothetical protein
MADYAVVVGITRYPRLSTDNEAKDLLGPNNDAEAVRDWLVDPDGGRLHPDNVKLICSAGFDQTDTDRPQPASSEIVDALTWVAEQTENDPGDRLYMYFSGHGFSPRLEEGALFTAEATPMRPEHVYAHGWLRWFRTAQQFRETVLWMDSCMNYQRSVPVSEVILRETTGTGPPPPAFMALAAQTKSALECTMADKQVHGVFTWTLLKGLAGGAADERGRITGDSLRRYLFTVMPEFLPDTARNSTAVDLNPFVRADDGIVFRRLESRPKYPVHLDFPADAEGAELRIWTGRPLRKVLCERLPGTVWNGELVRGLYVAEVQAAGLRHGFQVSGSGDVHDTVTQKGPGVNVTDGSELFCVDVVAGNQAASISVVDYQFERVFEETGELHERDLPGVYKIRTEFGRDITMISEQVVLLDRDGLPGELATPQLASPAPIAASATAHEMHTEQFEQAAERQATDMPPDLSSISILSRYVPEPGSTTAAPPGHPMDGLQLFDAKGERSANLAEECQVERLTEDDPVAVWEGYIKPGSYFLRQVLADGRQYEGCITASAEWLTQIAVQRTAQTEASAPSDALADVAVFMRQAGMTRSKEQDAVIEAARMALAQGRNLFADGHGAQLARDLTVDFTDPIAGIIGGHLLLQAMTGAAPDPKRADQFDSLVVKLRDLVGRDHPDVEALSLRCASSELRTTTPFTAPPMFLHSWQLVIDATYQQENLVPDELWLRVHAAIPSGTFFVWAADEQARYTHASQLARVVDEYKPVSRTWPAPDDLLERLSFDRVGAMADIGGITRSLRADRHEVGFRTAPPERVQQATARLHVPAGIAKALWDAPAMSPEEDTAPR